MTDGRMSTVGLASRRLSRLARISEFLGASTVQLKRFSTPFWRRNVETCDQIAGWGRKPTSLKARRAAVAAGLPFLCLEDGFLRSVGSGGEEPPLSIVVDDTGIYYDATTPSALERLIAAPLTDSQIARTRRLMAAWRTGRVSKYNKTRDYSGLLPERFVLVVDQTFNDDSIRCGLADVSSFQRMLEAAIRENPDCTVLVKTHPDALARRRKGHFDLKRIAGLPRVEILSADCHAASILEKAEAVYTVTSQMGFEALIWGKPVRCFGVPFYAGWGLTQDEARTPERRRGASLEQLVHAALVAYPRYIDPETGRRCEAETVLEHIALQRRMRSRFPTPLYCFGFSVWKNPMIRDFLAGSKLHFHTRFRRVPEGRTTVIWGNTFKDRIHNDTPALRVEDGFIRSIGLGAERRRPLSLAIDPAGIYYDSSKPSALEAILQSTAFDPVLIARAAALRERLVAERLSKYNLRAEHWSRPDTERLVVLVPGQVETDASIQFGAPGVRRNIDLLRAVREALPDAHVVYKPHPDVVAGLREPGTDEARAAEFCDEVVTGASIVQMIDQVDEVHVLTSLAGFEALIRAKGVTCYGQPFYAGWGLTRDVLPIARRSRRLTIDELVAGALILYPTYVSRVSGRFITPEQAVDDLLAWREKGDEHETSAGRAWRLLKKVERLLQTALPRLR
ncbi:capsular polysaccharide biosynthesis protein [Mesorhizobium sp. LHD-90]|uniref:capsular polysaccharide biosynthesis protein n=1 Tax=Mesorhizobium sp. LHD-90 TaxID=3071414 RepID=UPI0027E132EC|nr:capsular polysaccharide biosynthesis protein [Mesorhizobium sp. LHD-90]MDQ6437593.1 capsular polysaccharide biosynthesis protein [Mesorhizobium sp. LHD-90]